jgi:hypothetical protein
MQKMIVVFAHRDGPLQGKKLMTLEYKCQVVDVVFCFNTIAKVQLYDRRGRLYDHRVGKTDKETKKLLAEFEKVEKEIAALLEKDEGKAAKMMTCFVVFNRPEFAEKAVAKYQHCCYYLPCFRHICMPCSIRFRPESCAIGCHKGGSFPKVVRAPEPSNIEYANLGIPYYEKFKRRSLSNFITVVLVVLSMLFNFASSAYIKNVESASNNCTSYTWVDNEIAHNATDDWTGHNIVHCYCFNLAWSAYTEPDLCYTELKALTLATFVLQIVSTSMIVINYLLNFSVRSLAKYEKHLHISTEQSSIMSKAFMTLFINTAVIITLVNSDFTVAGLNLGLLGGGQFTQPSTGWFNIVGTTMTFNLFLMIGNPQGATLMATWSCLHIFFFLTLYMSVYLG